MAKENGFLNVDLELGARTRRQLAPLLAALDGKLFELFLGRIRSLYRAHYEVLGCERDASGTIRALVSVLRGLDAPARATWADLPMRDFNIGIELERGIKSVEIVIAPDVVRDVAALGGRIAITAYQVAAMKRARAKRVSRAARRA